MDKKKDLRAATGSLKALQVPALRDLSFFKNQLEVDFDGDPARKTELLKQPGFDKSFADARRGNQEAVIELLYAFKTNMNEALKNEMIAKGANPAS